jgi:hypothetical protein
MCREPSPLSVPHHPQTIGRKPELAGKPVLVLGNKVDLPAAVQDPTVLCAALHLPVVGPEGGVGAWGGPLAVRMCSGVRGEGYVEGAFSRSRPCVPDAAVYPLSRRRPWVFSVGVPFCTYPRVCLLSLCAVQPFAGWRGSYNDWTKH